MSVEKKEKTVEFKIIARKIPPYSQESLNSESICCIEITDGKLTEEKKQELEELVKFDDAEVNFSFFVPDDLTDDDQIIDDKSAEMLSNFIKNKKFKRFKISVFPKSSSSSTEDENFSGKGAYFVFGNYLEKDSVVKKELIDQEEKIRKKIIKEYIDKVEQQIKKDTSISLRVCNWILAGIASILLSASFLAILLGAGLGFAAAGAIAGAMFGITLFFHYAFERNQADDLEDALKKDKKLLTVADDKKESGLLEELWQSFKKSQFVKFTALISPGVAVAITLLCLLFPPLAIPATIFWIAAGISVGIFAAALYFKSKFISQRQKAHDPIELEALRESGIGQRVKVSEETQNKINDLKTTDNEFFSSLFIGTALGGTLGIGIYAMCAMWIFANVATGGLIGIITGSVIGIAAAAYFAYSTYSQTKSNTNRINEKIEIAASKASSIQHESIEEASSFGPTPVVTVYSILAVAVPALAAAFFWPLAIVAVCLLIAIPVVKYFFIDKRQNKREELLSEIQAIKKSKVEKLDGGLVKEHEEKIITAAVNEPPTSPILSARSASAPSLQEFKADSETISQPHTPGASSTPTPEAPVIVHKESENPCGIAEIMENYFGKEAKKEWKKVEKVEGLRADVRKKSEKNGTFPDESTLNQNNPDESTLNQNNYEEDNEGGKPHS